MWRTLDNIGGVTCDYFQTFLRSDTVANSIQTPGDESAMIGELSEVILYVDDMATAVGFYRDRLGLRVVSPECDDYGSEYWVVLETGSCKLCLHGGGTRCQGTDAPKVVFRVLNIHAARSQLIDRGVQLGEVRVPSAGVFVCDGTDPAGNRFSIEQTS